MLIALEHLLMFLDFKVRNKQKNKSGNANTNNKHQNIKKNCYQLVQYSAPPSVSDPFC